MLVRLTYPISKQAAEESYKTSFIGCWTKLHHPNAWEYTYAERGSNGNEYNVTVTLRSCCVGLRSIAFCILQKQNKSQMVFLVLQFWCGKWIKGNIITREDILLTKHGLRISGDAINYDRFKKQIEDSEQAFKSQFTISPQL